MPGDGTDAHYSTMSGQFFVVPSAGIGPWPTANGFDAIPDSYPLEASRRSKTSVDEGLVGPFGLEPRTKGAVLSRRLCESPEDFAKVWNGNGMFGG
jgi:hypothetical protein